MPAEGAVSAQSWLESRWYSDAPPPWLLRPLGALYQVVAAQRRRSLTGTSNRLPLPVIVVGNVSIGGTGKTPFVIWLVERLSEWGLRPGIISRGYGGRPPTFPFEVRPDSVPAHAGDEPLLIARRTGAPVIVDPDRVAAARRLMASADVNIIVADDGLQHYRLARDLEICVVDGARGLGNGAVLPAGPLREPPSRLREVDLVVVNGPGWQDASLNPLRMELEFGNARSLKGAGQRPLAEFASCRVHAVAGIGNPLRFFAALRQQGLEPVAHAFADHHRYVPAELDFGDGLPVLMTEKDAVKCEAFAAPHWWAVPVQARLGPLDEARVQESVIRLRTLE